MARPFGTKKTGFKYLKEDELKRFITVVKRSKSIRDIVMFGLTLRFGLRVQELCNIKLEDINHQAEQITIRGLKSGTTRTYDLTNEDAYRPDRENELFMNMKRWIRKERKKIDQKGMNPFLFPSALYPDKSITADGVKTIFKNYAKAAGLAEDPSIHSLRHTCAMVLVKENWSAIRVQNWLRHKSIQSTEVYFREIQLEADNREAAAAFSRLM